MNLLETIAHLNTLLQGQLSPADCAEIARLINALQTVYSQKCPIASPGQ